MNRPEAEGACCVGAREDAEKNVQEAAIARKLVLKMLGAPSEGVVVRPAEGKCILDRADTEIQATNSGR